MANTPTTAWEELSARIPSTSFASLLLPLLIPQGMISRKTSGVSFVKPTE